MKSTLLLIACSLLLTTNDRIASADEPSQETVAKIKSNLKNDKALLVDVREPRETDQGYVAGALLLPLSELQRAAAVPDVKKRIITKLPKKKVLYSYCRSGGRARVAAEALQEWGYKVQPLKLGFHDLLAEGFQAAQPEQ